MGKIDWQKLAAKLFCVLIFAVAVWTLPRLALKILMPFFLSALLCALLYPAARKMSRITRLGERACRVILLVLSFFILSVILFEAARRLYSEISEILARLGTGELTLFSADAFNGRIGEMLSELSSSMLSELAVSLGSVLKQAVGSAPSAILFMVSFVTSAIYFCLDGDRMTDRLSGFLPEAAQQFFARVREGIARATVGCVKAYTLLFALTFFLAFVGLLVLGRKYALTAAFLVALVDMLPVLGTGFLLLPWAVYLCLVGEIGVGIGLAVLWLIITAVKSAAEPHIIGESIGISPILSLVSAYVGFKIFGVLGMILAPIAAAITAEIVSRSRSAEKEKIQKNT